MPGSLDVIQCRWLFINSGEQSLCPTASSFVKKLSSNNSDETPASATCATTELDPATVWICDEINHLYELTCTFSAVKLSCIIHYYTQKSRANEIKTRIIQQLLLTSLGFMRKPGHPRRGGANTRQKLACCISNCAWLVLFPALFGLCERSRCYQKRGRQHSQSHKLARLPREIYEHCRRLLFRPPPPITARGLVLTKGEIL